ncbi:MAG: CopG family transcriptional regulator, partial [Gemmatimonadota bacterium]
MPDIPLSVRLPAELTDTLACRADERGVRRSMVVREAAADFLAA